MTQSCSAAIEGDEMRGAVSGGRGGERPFTAKRKGDLTSTDLQLAQAAHRGPNSM